jgi:hypothetical protein
MSGTILYSTNCRFAHDIAMTYRNGMHFAWVSECYDASKQPIGTPAAATPPSSSPKEIYDNLWKDCEREDSHSDTIKRIKKTFKKLAATWRAEKSITEGDYKEIVGLVHSNSWKIWRPVLYVIPKAPIVAAGRLITVPRTGRAGYGPEGQIIDLHNLEFDVIER